MMKSCEFQMGEIANLVLQSNEMLEVTIKKRYQDDKTLIKEVHNINIPVIEYNDKISLACVIMLVCLNERSNYKIV